MKAKKVVLVSGDVYEGCEMKSAEDGVFPKEMDAMVEVSLGKTKIYVNAAMIASLEMECATK